jgi:hypothetical protein
MTLKDNVLDVALTAYSGAQFQQTERREGAREPDLAAQQRGGAPVTLRGSFSNPGPQYTGFIEIHGDRIQFDEKLFAALLNPRPRTPRSLNCTFRLPGCADDPTIREMHQFARSLIAARSWRQVPVPPATCGQITATASGLPSRPELVGSNGAGVVGYRATPHGQRGRAGLGAPATISPVRRAARRASPSQRQLWLALQPHGKFDLDADVQFNSRAKR